LQRVKQELRGQAAAVRDLEARAHVALHQQSDPATYKRLMEEKCRLLSDLPRRLGGPLEAVDEPLRSAVADELRSVARRADQALSLDSVFYMSALLYPEDYREGEDNDLEAFVAGL
jgi:hypothetical protein